MPTFQVGEHVRILSADGEIACKATIAYVNTDATYEVVYDNRKVMSLDDEESNVSSDRIKPLLAFEGKSFSGLDAAQIKEFGNELFKAKDYLAAKEAYSQSNRLIRQPSPSVGTRVIIANDTQNTARVGLVSDLNDGYIEVIYEDGKFPEEEVVNESSTTVLCQGADLELQRTLFMNLARCSMKLKNYGWCVRWANFAIAVAQTQAIVYEDNVSLRDRARTSMSDALFMRGKCLLAASRPKLALEVAGDPSIHHITSP